MHIFIWWGYWGITKIICENYVLKLKGIHLKDCDFDRK